MDAFAEPGTLKQPGPIGRLVRLVFGATCGWFLVSLILAGLAQVAARFPDNRGLWPGVGLWGWALVALYLFSYVVNIGFGKTWGRWPQIAVIACAFAASILSFIAYDSFWGPPLAWFMIGWLVYIYSHLAISFLLSAILATPGCEMRALPHLFAIISSHPSKEHCCQVGPLSRIDAWEANRRSGSKNER